MKKFFVFTALLVLFSSAFAADIKGHLLPTPKELKVGEMVAFEGSKYTFVDNFGLSARRKARFAETLKKKLGWQESSDGKIKIILNKLNSNPVANDEYYTFSTSADTITISAAKEPGIMRGLGRFAGLIESPLFNTRFDGNFETYRLDIADYPDFERRPVLLGAASLFKNSKKADVLTFINDFIEKASAMQFNCIAYELGGRLQMAKYPDINQPGPSFSAAEMAEIMDHIEDRGMTVIPMINCIGHFGRAPNICPYKTLDGKRTFMNIADPKCMPMLLDYIDEVIKVFRNPKYFSIGTDEFHREVATLEKLFGKPFHEFYPEFVNKVNAHMKSRNVAMLICHDMLMPMGSHPYPEEVGSGPSKQGKKALAKIDKDIHVMYWNYFHSYHYYFIKDLQDAGVKNIWMLPHSGSAAVQALLKRSLPLGKNIMATSWFLVLQSNCYPHAAEYSWNIYKDFKKSEFDFNDMNDALFFSRNTKTPAVDYKTIKLAGAYAFKPEYAAKFNKRFPEKAVTASGIPFNFSTAKTLAAPGVVLEKELTIDEAKQFFDSKKAVYMGAENAVAVQKLSKFKVNAERKHQDIVVYTSKHGKSTGTNRRGLEVAVGADGKVVELSGNCFQRTGDEHGNMAIPEGGYVVSYGNSQPYLSHPGYSLFFKLSKGEKFRFTADNDTKHKSGMVSGVLYSKYRKVAIAVTCTESIRPGGLGFIEIKMQKGKSKFARINSYYFTTGLCIFLDGKDVKRYNPFPMVRHGLNPVIVLEYTIPEGADAKAIYISTTRQGALSGLSVLGVTQY